VKLRSSRNLPVWTAMAAAGLMMAHQVGSKAIRDALFLSTHQSSALPRMMIAAALLSVLMGGMSSKLFGRLSPAKVVPWGFITSGVLQIGEWILVGINPEIGSVVVYLHIVAFAAVLQSSFWLLLSEQTNPQDAKKRYGRIAGMGTVGGVMGGLLAARWTTLMPATSLLVALGVLHVVVGVVLMGTRRPSMAAVATPAAWESPGKALASAPHLRYLAVLVLLGTASAAMLDFLFKSSAAAAFGKGEPLLRFFALFYMCVSVVSFGLQTLVSRLSLEKLGVARTVSALPLSLAGGATLAYLAPIFPLFAFVRGLESSLRGSLFRAGYELFYTPIPPQEKRAAKTVIDVGCDRLGDAAGGLICLALVKLPPQSMVSMLLLITGGIALVNSWVAGKLDKVYVAVVERGLLNRASEVHMSGLGDWAVDPELLESRAIELPRVETPVERVTNTMPADLAVRHLADLRSGDMRRVRSVLAIGQGPDPALVPAVIDLLAWDAASQEARAALMATSLTITGQLADRLVDTRSDFAIRRRIPSILASRGDRRAVEGLMAGLRDERFEVRYRCARALDLLVGKHPELKPAADEVYEAIDREMSVDERLWHSRRLVDEHGSSDQFSYLDEVLRERADRSLEHVFSLLALILPREPLKAAFRSLHSNDELLEGLAMEYMDGVLPPNLREKLRMLQRKPAGERLHSTEEAAQLLLRSHQSIELKIRQLAEARAAAQAEEAE